MSSAGTAQIKRLIKRLFQLSKHLLTRHDTHPPAVYPRGVGLGGSWGPFFSHPRSSKALGLSGECQESPGKQPPPHRAEPILGRVPAIEACIACSDTSCHAQLLEQPVRVCAPLCTPTSPTEDTSAHRVRCSALPLYSLDFSHFFLSFDCKSIDLIGRSVGLKRWKKY